MPAEETAPPPDTKMPHMTSAPDTDNLHTSAASEAGLGVVDEAAQQPAPHPPTLRLYRVTGHTAHQRSLAYAHGYDEAEANEGKHILCFVY